MAVSDAVDVASSRIWMPFDVVHESRRPRSSSGLRWHIDHRCSLMNRCARRGVALRCVACEDCPCPSVKRQWALLAAISLKHPALVCSNLYSDLQDYMEPTLHKAKVRRSTLTSQTMNSITVAFELIFSTLNLNHVSNRDRKKFVL